MTAETTGLPTAGGTPVLGSTTPRLWTPPLRDLSEPGATYGPLVTEFAARILGMPFDPWQAWAADHIGELLPDGRPRFRVVLVLVARQNGKSYLGVAFAAFWQVIEQVPLVMSLSSKLEYARDFWEKSVTAIGNASETLPDGTPGPLAGLVPARRKDWVRDTNGQERSTVAGSEHRITAANGNAGRSKTIHRAIADELRQQTSYAAWAAFYPAMNAVPDGQVIGLSNAGTEESRVLADKREAALRYIATGEGDPRLGILEWSAPDDARPTDLQALAQANPNLGRRIDADTLLGEARTAIATGGEALATFRIEAMCQWVPDDGEAAIPRERWMACLDTDMSMDEVADRIAICVDMSPDGRHLTAVAAGVDDDAITRIAVIGAWHGQSPTVRMRAELPEIMAAIAPHAAGYFANGPAAAIKVDLDALGFTGLDSAAKAACQGMSDLVESRMIARWADPLLDDHVLHSRRLGQGDGWRFGRRGTGHVDAAYAAAGAIHLARTLPAPPQLRVV